MLKPSRSLLLPCLAAPSPRRRHARHMASARSAQAHHVHGPRTSWEFTQEFRILAAFDAVVLDSA